MDKATQTVFGFREAPAEGPLAGTATAVEGSCFGDGPAPPPRAYSAPASGRPRRPARAAVRLAAAARSAL